MQLPPLPFIVLDTETTGLLPRIHRVIEFACVKVERGEVAQTYEQLFTISEEIPPIVQALTRITQEDLAGRPSFREKREEMLEHIGKGTLIVGQNVSFDLAMLKGEGLDLTEQPLVDTAMLASLVFPELQSYSLGYLSTVLGLKHEPQHRALGDVYATLGLVGKCWERLSEVSPEFSNVARIIMQKAPSGYKLLFDHLPKTHRKKPPRWLERREHGTVTPPKSAPFPLPKSEKGVVQLIEEPLSPGFLRAMIDAALIGTPEERVAVPRGCTWIAVKNLEATVSALFSEGIPDGVRILYPPFLLPDPTAIAQFASQGSYTSDEATLALKLSWYEPRTRADLPLHGNEDAVWSGKIACTETSPTYTEQFQNLPAVILLDHRQLLTFLADPEHAAHGVLTENASIVIDDASMLEDTATKAYGWVCMVDDLRAAAEGDAVLTRFTDVLQLWIERVRQFKDLHYLGVAELRTPDAHGLRKHLAELLTRPLPNQALRTLRHLAQILDPEKLPGRIVWLEQGKDGSHELHSVPERINTFLKEHLYDRFATTLLIPPGSASTLTEVLPPGTKTLVEPRLTTPAFAKATAGRHDSRLSIVYPEDRALESILKEPPAGRMVILIPSRATIEDLFVKYVEALEEKRVTLICQGISGGQGRARAEFLATSSAVWAMTPWMFEGVALPAESIDHLVLAALPFDHPSHPVTSKRAMHYRDAFAEYSLPRLEHRLFRLLRTFARSRPKHGDVHILDERLRTKDYGARLRRYLEQFMEHEDAPREKKPARPPVPEKQPSLF